MTDRDRLEAFFAKDVETYYSHTRHVEQEDDALKAVCQAIMWACALDEFRAKPTSPASLAYKSFRASDPAGQQMRGVRYARNRALHQAAELVKVIGGAVFPVPLAAPFFEIVWRTTIELPPPDASHLDPAGETIYIRSLQDQPVRFALDALADFFKRAP